MSIDVTLHELAETVARYRFAYLVTVRDDGERTHVVAATPTLVGGHLLVPDPGRTTRANLAARPAATLVWPPAEPGGYTLIVDGVAELRDGQVRVQPSRAVLHRPAPDQAGSSTGCTADCAELSVVPEPTS
ncbi:MAG: hypothetical protein L0H64_20795 [Pseudonocardia sp.]|nr:hypothetical protein [Pseudonocardia sp.]